MKTSLFTSLPHFSTLGRIFFPLEELAPKITGGILYILYIYIMSKFLSPVTTWLTVPHMCTWRSVSESALLALWEPLSLYHPLAEMTQKGSSFNEEFNLLSHLGRRKKTALLGV